MPCTIRKIKGNQRCISPGDRLVLHLPRYRMLSISDRADGIIFIGKPARFVDVHLP